MQDMERKRREIVDRVRGQTICDLLRRNATTSPDHPALSWRQGDTWRTMTWREYRQQVAAATLGLVDLGVGRGDTVALMGGNRAEHVIGDQGAVHAGATPTTLYKTLAPEQIAYVARNCDAKVAILENRDYMKRWTEVRSELPHVETFVLMEHAEEFSELDGVVSWDALMERGRSIAADAPARFDELTDAVEPDDVACLIYTSGTTGPPKGVRLTHANLRYEAEALDQVTGVPDHASNVSYLPLAHIAERMLSIYLPLQKIGHSYFCPEIDHLLEYLQEARPSSFFGVPRVWEKFKAAITANIDAEDNATRRRLAQRAIRVGTAVVRTEQHGDTPSLLLRAEHAVLDRLVLSRIRDGIGLGECEFTSCAAAPLPVDVAEFFAAIGLPLMEVYGMTETTGVATANRPGALRIGTVGPALPGVEVTLADDDEVLVRGPVNTPGYHDMPEETAALIDDDGWLHTGDIGDLDADGYLSIVDRKKELIITAGGKNISPAHIESLLKEHPLVGQALAYGDRKPYVVALVVFDPEVAPGWAEKHGIDGDDVRELAEDPQIRAEVERAVTQANERLARAEQVKTFTILPAEWTPESEELTPTMKLKRRVIHDKYDEAIEALYRD